ncbi:hypothetical protein JavanS219_0016 [Streptococcus satellite phage Javan219]|nr:hypothetical protein JavanS219_0016 [Streptococcus satellite phage Javan219]SEP86182.1 hypothetical protein SAMN05216346_102174 [Streptococcus equinus]
MKKWKTITTTALITSAVTIGGVCIYTSQQPAHYEGKTFKSSVSSSTTEESSSTTEESSSTTEESSTTVIETETQSIQYSCLQIFDREHCQNPSQQMADGVYYSIDSVNYTMTAVVGSGFYVLASPANCPEYIEVLELKDGVAVDSVKVTGDGNYNVDPSLNKPWENAEVFCKWLRQQAPSGHTTNGLQSNYNYWVKNCKYKYKQ